LIFSRSNIQWPSEISPPEEVTREFEAAWHTIRGSGCRSWYLEDCGVPASWPWTFDRFREEMAAPKLKAYEQVG
jgi:hypothetical protein